MGEIKKNKMKNKSSGNGRTISLKDSIGFKLPLIITLIFVVSLSLITAVAFFSSANKSVSENKEKIGWKANYLMATFQGISNQYYTAAGSTAEIKFVVEHLAGEDKGPGGKKNENNESKDGAGQQQNQSNMITDALSENLVGLDGCDSAYIIDVNAKTIAATSETLPDISGLETVTTALNGKFCVSPAHVSSATGNYVITYFAPIENGDAVVGAVAMDYQLENLQKLLVI